MKKAVILVCLFTVFSSAFCTNSSIQLRFQDSLINYFYFDEGVGGRVSDIANGYYGNLMVLYNWVTGRLNTGLEFYGNNYISVNYIAPELLGNNSKTVAAWVYPTQLRNAIVYLGGSHGPGETFRLISDDTGHIGLNVSNGEAFSSIQLRLNEWNFIAVLWNGTVYKVCNERRCERLYNLPVQNLHQGLYLIGKDNETNYYTKGIIDELYVFNTSLTESEVRELAGLYLGNISLEETEDDSSLINTISSALQVSNLSLDKTWFNNTPIYYINITLINMSNTSYTIIYSSLVSAKDIYAVDSNSSIELNYNYNSTNLIFARSKENTSLIVLNFSLNNSFETYNAFFEDAFNVEFYEACSNLTCSAWSSCSNNSEQRMCTESFCGFSREEKIFCEGSQTNNFLLYEFGIIILVIIAVIVIYIRQKIKQVVPPSP